MPVKTTLYLEAFRGPGLYCRPLDVCHYVHIIGPSVRVKCRVSGDDSLPVCPEPWTARLFSSAPRLLYYGELVTCQLSTELMFLGVQFTSTRSVKHNTQPTHLSDNPTHSPPTAPHSRTFQSNQDDLYIPYHFSRYCGEIFPIRSAPSPVRYSPCASISGKYMSAKITRICW